MNNLKGYKMVTTTPISVTASHYPGIERQNNETRDRVIIRRKTVDERLQDFFENSKEGDRQPLENFRGDRKIEAYRGKGFVNKVTTKLPTETTPKIEFIRYMKEVPIKGSAKPNFVDHATIMITNEGRGIFQVYKQAPGTSDTSILVKVFRTYHQSVQRFFSSVAEMRQDKYIMSLLKQITKKLV